jgi:glutathione S-transferase
VRGWRNVWEIDRMKLYITDGSPYARMARMLIVEKRLDQQVELVSAQTRLSGSPYYAINPSGRVPCLVRDDGVCIEESALICAYLDSLDGKPMLREPTGALRWEALRLEARARSMLDGLAVWMRELRRPEHERSPTIVRHEADRSVRMADFWEGEIEHPWMQRALNMAQLTLACALGLEHRFGDYAWRSGRPGLTEWFDAFSQRPSFRLTAPTVTR